MTTTESAANMFGWPSINQPFGTAAFPAISFTVVRLASRDLFLGPLFRTLKHA